MSATDREHIYVVRLPGQWLWVTEYSHAFELATGQKIGEWSGDEEHEEEHRISIMHKRGREYVLDLSDDDRVREKQMVCMNRSYDCGHAAYGPPRLLPGDCPECKPVATDGGTGTGVTSRFTDGDLGVSDIPDTELQSLSSIVQYAVSKRLDESVEAIYVMGSFARDEAKEKLSDLDIRVLVSRPVPEDERRECEKALKNEYGPDAVPSVAGYLDAHITPLVPTDDEPHERVFIHPKYDGNACSVDTGMSHEGADE